METRLVKINNMEDCKKDMEEAGELIKAGELVAFPTETVYGLGGNGLLPDAAKKIYAAKGRPSDNPLILHVCDMQMVESLVKEIPDNARPVSYTHLLARSIVSAHQASILSHEVSLSYRTKYFRYGPPTICITSCSCP